MARKRMIDPSFWRDEKIAQCTHMERLLFQGLWTFAEDSGVGRANPLLIKADIFPYDTLREADIKRSLDKLSSLGLIKLYEADGQHYYMVKNFLKHQTINRPSQCTLPMPQKGDDITLTEHSLNAHGALTPKEKLIEEKLIEEKTAYGEFKKVLLFEKEYKKLTDKYDRAIVDDKIAYLDAQIQSKVKKYMAYKDHYATLTNWCRSDGPAKGTSEPKDNAYEYFK